MKYMVLICIGLFADILFKEGLNRKLKKEKEQAKDELKKTGINNTILLDWLSVKQANINLEKYLSDNKITQVAVYGYGILGKAFLNELKNSSISVKCVIDKNFKNIKCTPEAIGLESIPDVDAIVVCAVNYYDEISDELHRYTKNTIISLEDIIYGVSIYE